MRILYYNWADYRSGVGGGVTVYQRNLLAELEKYSGTETVFLSAGNVYSPFSSRAFIRRRKNSGRTRVFELVNSPVAAPAALLYNNLRPYLSKDETVLNLLTNFIRGEGGFDVLHFNNLEGLPLNVLKLKERFPQMKIVFSIHNYFLFCPLVQLFQNHRGKSCNDFCGGGECLRCRYKDISPEALEEKFRNYFVSASWLFKLFKPLIKQRAKMLAKKVLSAGKQQNTADTFAHFRQQNIAYINAYADVVLCVSERVRQIATHMGINSELARVSYIGTGFAHLPGCRKKGEEQAKEPFVLAYLGYARADKGFFFLTEALRRLDDNTSGQVKLLLAAKKINAPEARQAVSALRGKFAGIEVYDGFSHAEMESLLKNVTLGVIPVIWEDNLPQIAIELPAHGVPVLSSSMGGASELCSSPYFTFEGGNHQDFVNKLAYIAAHREVLDDYWRCKSSPVSMEDHVQELARFYG